MELTWDVDTSGSSFTVVRLSGTLDVATTVQARMAFHKALADDPAAVLVDLTGLHIAEDVSVTVFAATARAAAAWPGCPLFLYAPDAPVRRDLDRMAVTRLASVYGDRTAAETAAGKAPVPRRYLQRLPSIPLAVALGRDLVDEACTAWHLDELADPAALIATELVTNALRHASGELTLTVALRAFHLLLAVTDGSPEEPRRRHPDPDTLEGGRGLLMLDALSAAWGSHPRLDGKVVWASLRLPRPSS
jgi:anti-anti-sigma regulatory factor